MPRVGKVAQKAMDPAEVGALQQHIQDLKVQLLNANKVIQSLQRRARSISVTSGYTSGAERPPPGTTAVASSAHSLTDEDEGWQSDGHGTLCPPALRARRDLQHLVHRVALLEAQLPTAKLRGVLPKELQSATWPGYGHGAQMGLWDLPGWWLLVICFSCSQAPGMLVLKESSSSGQCTDSAQGSLSLLCPRGVSQPCGLTAYLSLLGNTTH